MNALLGRSELLQSCVSFGHRLGVAIEHASDGRFQLVDGRSQRLHLAGACDVKGPGRGLQQFGHVHGAAANLMDEPCAFVQIASRTGVSGLKHPLRGALQIPRDVLDRETPIRVVGDALQVDGQRRNRRFGSRRRERRGQGRGRAIGTWLVAGCGCHRDTRSYQAQPAARNELLKKRRERIAPRGVAGVQGV